MTCPNNRHAPLLLAPLLTLAASVSSDATCQAGSGSRCTRGHSMVQVRAQMRGVEAPASAPQDRAGAEPGEPGALDLALAGTAAEGPGKCRWFRHYRSYAPGARWPSGGLSQKAAMAKCPLDPRCKAITCSHSRYTGTTCTLRASSKRIKSYTQEVTYVPHADCRPAPAPPARRPPPPVRGRRDGAASAAGVVLACRAGSTRWSCDLGESSCAERVSSLRRKYGRKVVCQTRAASSTSQRESRKGGEEQGAREERRRRRQK